MKHVLFIVLMCAVLAGCGLKMTPVTASRKLVFDTALNRANAARIGESLIFGQDMFVLPAYSPAFPGQLPSPEGGTAVVAKPGQQWTAVSRLEDGSLLLEPPLGTARAGHRLGLRVDESGRVVGHRPWFDLNRKCRITQPYWGRFQRAVFRPSTPYPIDVFVFGLRYEGLDSGLGVINYSDFKRTGVKGGEVKALHVQENDILRLHGLNILVFGLYPDHVRYVVEGGEAPWIIQE